MALLETGRLCIKRYGRDAGCKAVVSKIMDGSFVGVMTAKRLKERRCNIAHLEFLNESVDIKDMAEVKKALGVVEKEAHKPKAKK